MIAQATTSAMPFKFGAILVSSMLCLNRFLKVDGLSFLLEFF
jgi:hypothetical protein